jgi:hypothetical protein
MINVAQTIISQYANSPTLTQLIRSLDGYIDPQADFDNFYNQIWNINTAQGFGLDIWGRILGISRQINVPAIYPVLVAPGLTNLTDAQYRTLLLVKALTNISESTAPSINNALKKLFVGRGNAFTVNQGGMHMQYKFLFALQPYEYAIMASQSAITVPAGVGTSLFSINPYFGFNEAISWQPFGQGVFAAY